MRTKLYAVGAVLTKPGPGSGVTVLNHYVGYRDATSEEEAVGKVIKYLTQDPGQEGFTITNIQAIEIVPVDIADMFELQQKEGAS